MVRNPSNPLQYLVGILSAVVALGLSLLFLPVIRQIPGTFFFVAIAFTAWYARIGPALLAALLSALALDYYFLEPLHQLNFQWDDIVRSLVFLAIASIVAGISRMKRRSDRAAIENSEVLRVTIASIGDAVIACDQTGRITFVNAVASALTGWPEEDAVGRRLEDVFAVVSDETGEDLPSPVERVLAEKRIIGLTDRTVLIARDGRRVPIEDSTAPIRLPDGSIEGVVLVFRDDSVRRSAERDRERLLTAERASHEDAELARRRFEFLASASEILSSSLDYRQTLTSAVQLAVPHLADWAAIDMLDDNGEIRRLAVAHINPEKVKWAWELQELYPPDPEATSGVPAVIRSGRTEFYPEIPDEMLVASAETEEQLRVARELHMKSAVTVPIRLREGAAGAITFVTAESGRRLDRSDVALAEDFARRASVAIENARLYQQVARSNEYLQVTLASIGDGVISIDYEGRVALMNRVAETLTGWSAAEAAGRPLAEILHTVTEASNEPNEDMIESILREGRTIERADGTLLVSRSGIRTPIEYSGSPIRTDEARSIGFVLSIRDVSERRRAEIDLRTSRDQLDAILAGVSDAVTAQGSDGRLVFANEAAALLAGFESTQAMLSCPPADITGRFEFFDEQGHPLPFDQLPARRALRTGRPARDLLGVRTVGSDEMQWHVSSATPTFDESGNTQLVINVSHDITRLKLAERSLRERARQQTALAELGQRALVGVNIDELLDEVVRTVAETLDIEMVKVLEVMPDRTKLLIRAGVGWQPGVVGHATVELANGTQAGYTLMHVGPIIVDDLTHEQRFRGSDVLHSHGVISGMTVTIGSRENPFGILGAHSREHRRFSVDDALFLQAMASLLASSIGRRRAESALEHQRESLRVTISSIGDAVIATDTRARITLLNPVAEHLTGWRQAEAMGRQLDDVFPIINETTGEPAENPALKALAEGAPVGLANHTVLLSRDGRRIPIDDSSAPIRDRDGNVVGVVLVFHDVTEQRRAEQSLRESEERYRTVAETASDVIIVADQEGTVRFANPALRSVFGYDPEDVIGRDLAMLMPVRARSAFHRGFTEYLKTHRRSTDWKGVALPGLHRSGHEVPLEVSYGEFYRDGAHYFTGVIRDVSERQRAEKALKEAKEQAEAANEAKDRFMAVLSHELRTPLTPVLTLVQYLESVEKPPEDVGSIYETIRRNVELEARLIDDLLDLTRISRGKLHLNVEFVDVHSLLRNTVEICSEEMEDKEIELGMLLEAGDYQVMADPARLQQVFWNLLQNAVKFTPDHGSITIRSSNPEPGRISIAVQDTGIGMEPEQLDRVFNPFEQAEKHTSRRFGGLGLGLSISQSIVEMLGGTIAAASDGPDRGATFTVELDTTSAPPAERAGIVAASNGNAHNGHPVRILLVDDHADTSNVMKLLLERRGFQVETAANVTSALRAASIREFDLLISDIGLPDGSGLELMRRIREIRPLAGIALSGFGMEEDIQRSHDAGFSEHLIKPINFATLQEAIGRVLGA